MKPKFRFLMVTLFLTSLLLNSCTLPVLGSSAYILHLVNPISGEVDSLGTQITLRGEVNYPSSQSPVTRITFWANGLQVGGGMAALDVSPEDPTTTDVLGTQNWTPPAAGEYQIQFQTTMSNGSIAISTPNRICVLDFALPLVSSLSDPGVYSYSDTGAYGYTGPCPLPTPTIGLAARPLSIAGMAAPSSLTFSDPPTCEASPFPTLTFQASANDLSGRIALVTVDYGAYAPAGGGSETIVLNGGIGSPLPTRTYSGTTDDLDGILASLTDASGHAISGDVVWTLHAYGRDGTLLESDGPHSIPAVPCSGVAGTPVPLVIAASPTSTLPVLILVPTATDTAVPTLISIIPTTKVNKGSCVSMTDQASCQKDGCFWQFSTNTCHNKGNGCSTYKNPSACTTSGCTWDKSTSTCH